jgi:hypothetical protein
VQPRDPSSVDADAIDLRASRAAGAPEPDDREPVASEDEVDPDNPFSLGSAGSSSTAASPQAAPPSGVRLRHRSDVVPGQPLGPGPIPGPIAGRDGTLDLTHVGPAGVDEGPEFLPVEPSRRRVWWMVIRLLASAGIIGIGTTVGAILGAAGVDTWIAALVAAALSVVLTAPLWSMRWARR